MSFQINGRYVAYAHTIFAYSAFLTALACGLGLHYTKIVENQYYTYPDEWFPSVSATIGDRYPERSFFQVFIAITSGARFALVFLWYLLVARPTTVKSSKFLAGVGLFRTITCGGWTYVTSTDDHDWHDIFMISYLVATIPWTVGCITLGPRNPRSLKWRKIFAGCFFGTILPLVYFFIQHKVHRVAGGEFCSPFSFFSFPPLLFLPSLFSCFCSPFFSSSFGVFCANSEGVFQHTRSTPSSSGLSFSSTLLLTPSLLLTLLGSRSS